ncbi:MAG: guanylate kinase [Candidatus Weimeria sp.]
MGKLYVIVGKSASGKDTLEKKLIEDKSLGLHHIVPYTTRPIREGEKDGVDYHFCTISQFRDMAVAKKIIEYRTYKTVLGDWTYFTADDGQIDLDRYSSIIVGTLESLECFTKYFGSERVVPIYIEVEDGERLQRALNRERQEKNPKYSELCRRFLADQEDFSEKNLYNAGVVHRFENTDTDRTAEQIADFIKGDMNGH